MEMETITIETILEHLPYRRMDIRFFAERPVHMRHWIGAVLRNNFLRAAEEVHDAQGISLRQRLDTLPLPEQHFLYGQLCGGFPKGFFFDCSDIPYEAPGFVLQANRVYTVSLVRVGRCAGADEEFVEAVRRMFARGFGHPVVPLSVIDIVEDTYTFASPDARDMNGWLELTFKTPVCLMRSSREDSQGYQNKLNYFPSFYQLMRSLSYRLLTLGILYGDCDPWTDRRQMDDWVQDYIVPSVRAMLMQADLRYEKRYGTPKGGEKSVYVMGGYVGKLAFGNVLFAYIPVLDFASGLGVGGDIQYGLGCFAVKYRNHKSNTKGYESDY